MQYATTINGETVYLSDTPVRMFDDAGIEVGVGTIDETVAQGLWCRSVHAWIINKKGELYLQQRSMHVVNNPGKWSESAGGYVDGTATDIETAATEIKEELGLDIDPARFEKIGLVRQQEIRYDGKTGKQFVSVFIIEYDFENAQPHLSEQDVKNTMKIHWREFADKLQKGEIDFVDHKEEIELVLSEIAKRY